MRLLILLAATALLVPLPLEAQVSAARVYVRRIEFVGVTRIEDEVLRREMLQLEGAFLNTVALEQSRFRLERLPAVADVTMTLRPVPGEANVVDVVVEITEAPTRRYGGGGAYSESQRASVHGYFINENLFGRGQRLVLRAETSELGSNLDISHTDPYARPAGVSRTIGVASRRVDRLTADTSSIDAELAEARLDYGYRVGERHSVRFGLGARATELRAGAGGSDQLLDWVGRNGDTHSSGGVSATEFTELDFRFGWSYDSRDRTIFPRTGTEQTLSIRAAVPGSDVEYYTADYEVIRYWSIAERWTLSLRGVLGYGRAYDDTSALPPYLNWFAGGPRTVRGFRENGLGPRDSLGNPYGGNLRTAVQAELMTPWPGKWGDRMQAGFFLDAGNVFSTEDVLFEEDGRRLDFGFDATELRRSLGVAVDVLLPLARVRLSYAVPLNAQDDHPIPALRDRIERFQISLGIDF